VRRFDAWIRSIDSYSGSDLLYLNPKGIIPPAAVIKKGEKRANPFKDKKRFNATGFIELKEGHTEGQSEEEVEEEVMGRSCLAETEG
jgi:tRNA pseudouridine38-40 synthase